jgi:hypothetical protein
MGKGSDQRKRSPHISDLEFAERWEQIFGKNNANAKKYKWKKTKESRKKFL